MSSCSSNQSLFQLAFQRGEDEWQSSRDGLIWELRSSSLADPLEKYYGKASNVTDFSKCLPNTDCLWVNTNDLPLEVFTIKFGGQVYKPTILSSILSGGDFSTTTEFGLGCASTCNNGTSLFEFEIAQNIERDSSILWQVEDSNGDIVYERDGEEHFIHRGSTVQVFNWQKCLPKKGCYYFTIATKFGGDDTMFSDRGPLTSYTLKWDGEMPLQGSVTSNLTFTDSKRFGGKCEEPLCPNGSSLFEAFVWQDYYSSANLFWTLNDTRSTDLVHSGSVENSMSNSSLHRIHKCIPVSYQCLTFNIGTPASIIERVIYSVRLGDTVYRDKNQYLKANDTYWPSNETTILGNGCMANSVCSEAGDESLVEVDIVTGSEGPYLAMWQLGWSILNNETFEVTISSSDLVDYYMSNTQYKAFSCLPKDVCNIFAMDEHDTGAEQYTVRYDGAIYDERTTHDDNTWGSGYVTTALGCPVPAAAAKLSTGAIVGIVLGCLVGVPLIAAAMHHFYKTRLSSKDDDGEDEKEQQEPPLA